MDYRAIARNFELPDHVTVTCLSAERLARALVAYRVTSDTAASVLRLIQACEIAGLSPSDTSTLIHG